MKHTRSDVVRVVSSLMGARRGDSIHRYILNTYNKAMGSHWDVKTPWCAITFSVPAIVLNYRDIIPVSASCGELIKQAKSMGIWVENDAYIPKIGEGIIYAWDDGKDFISTDNTTGHDHVGWVVDVNYKTNKFLVIEGNMGFESVCGSRVMDVNGQYIRGFICPKYDDEKDAEPVKKTYTVVKGDYLIKIEKKTGVSWETIAELNGIKAPYIIYPGQVLRLE